MNFYEGNQSHEDENFWRKLVSKLSFLMKNSKPIQEFSISFMGIGYFLLLLYFLFYSTKLEKRKHAVETFIFIPF